MDISSISYDKKKDRQVLIDSTYEISLSEEFTNKIINNNVKIDFNPISEELFSDVERYERNFSEVMMEIFGIDNPTSDTSKFGKQIFKYDSKTHNWKKSWTDCSYSRYKSIKDTNLCNFYINKFYKLQCLMSNTFYSHFMARWKEVRFSSEVFEEVFEEVMRTSEKILVKSYFKNMNWKNHKDSNYFRYILLKNLVRGYSQKNNDNRLWIDIDNDPNNEKLLQCLNFLHNPKILYAEKSNYSQGIHLCILYDKPIRNELRDQLEKRCKEQGFKIECCFYKHFLQLFGSIDYSPIDIEYFEKTGKFYYVNQLSFKRMIAVLMKLTDRYDSKQYINSTNQLIRIIDNDFIFEQESFLEKVQRIEKEKEQYQKEHQWDIITKNPVQYISKTKSKKYNFIKAESGNKKPALINNIFTCLSNGIRNNDDIRYYLDLNKGTSETISFTSDNDINIIKNYYDEKYQKKSILKTIKPQEFHSNLKLLDNDTILYIKLIQQEFNKSFLNNSKKYYKDKTNTKQKDLEIISNNVLPELIGKWIYQSKNPVEIQLPKHLLNNFKQDLFTGYDISITFIQLLLQFLKSKKLITHDFSARRIRDIIIQSLNIIPTFQYKNMKSYNTENINLLITNLPLQFNIYKDKNTTIQNNIQNILKQFKHIYSIKELQELSKITTIPNNSYINISYNNLTNNLYNPIKNNNSITYIYVVSKLFNSSNLLNQLQVNDPPN